MDSVNQTTLLTDFLKEWHSGQGITARTSGSTGVPKEITLSLETVKRSARRTNNFFGISKKSHLHCAISFEFIGGKMMIARSLVAACNLTFSEPSLRPDIPQTHTVDLVSVVPAQMPYILENLDKFSNVKSFLIGGSALNDALWNKIASAGIEAWESYGMTETASHIALRRIKGPANLRPRFVPLPGVRVFTDESGRLHIRDDKSFYSTNDLAEITPDNTFNILGRFDDMIISGGLKVLPQTVENALKPYITEFVSDFFIASIPDERWTSMIILVCVPKGMDANNDHSASQTLQMENLSQIIRERIERIPESQLSHRLRPKEIRIMNKLPLTASGKLLRRLQ